MSGWFPDFKELVTQLITAGIGGAVVAAFTYGLAFYRQRKIESRFPIAGEYLSFYEDTEEGRRTVVSSVASLNQTGKSVTVTNQLPNGRSWTLEGTILPGGHISGVYSADSAHDQGVGSFYLRIAGKDLDGMWSGYDHSNRITNAGRYWFRRMTKVSIRPATAEDVGQMLAISEKVFGLGYMHDLAESVHSPAKVCLVAQAGKRIAGFCISELLPVGNLSSFVGQSAGNIPDDVSYADRIGRLCVIKTIAVDPLVQRRGVGSKLFEESERRLQEKGAEVSLVPAWVYDKSANIIGLLKRHNYDYWFWDQLYWKGACENKEFACCKFDGACRCSMAMYRRRL